MVSVKMIQILSITFFPPSAPHLLTTPPFPGLPSRWQPAVSLCGFPPEPPNSSPPWPLRPLKHPLGTAGERSENEARSCYSLLRTHPRFRAFIAHESGYSLAGSFAPESQRLQSRLARVRVTPQGLRGEGVALSPVMCSLADSGPTGLLG